MKVVWITRKNVFGLEIGKLEISNILYKGKIDSCCNIYRQSFSKKSVYKVKSQSQHQRGERLKQTAFCGFSRKLDYKTPINVQSASIDFQTFSNLLRFIRVNMINDRGKRGHFYWRILDIMAWNRQRKRATF